MAAADLTRNPVGHQASVLYGLDLGEAKRCAPAARVAGADHLRVCLGPGGLARVAAATGVPLGRLVFHKVHGFMGFMGFRVQGSTVQLRRALNPETRTVNREP